VETMPNAANIDAGIIVYNGNYANATSTVSFKRRLTVDSMFVQRENYDKLRAVYSRITAADQEQVVLRKAAAKAAK